MTTVLHAGVNLAERLERFAARETARMVDIAAERFPELGAARIEVAGAMVAYLGPDSPVNQVVGLGFERAFTHADAEEIEAFFAARGALATVALCPLAHESVHTVLSARGWSLGGFENLLALDLSALPEHAFAATPPAGMEVRPVVTDEDRELWGHLVANGFSAPEDPTPAELSLGALVAHRADETFLTAYIDGRPAGTSELHIEDGIGWLSADTTLPHFRGRGVQGTLQRMRLALARDAGCSLAVTEARPGSGSQRNMERLGFRVMYTRADLLAPPRAGSAVTKEGTA